MSLILAALTSFVGMLRIVISILSRVSVRISWNLAACRILSPSRARASRAILRRQMGFSSAARSVVMACMETSSCSGVLAEGAGPVRICQVRVMAGLARRLPVRCPRDLAVTGVFFACLMCAVFFMASESYAHQVV